MTVQSRSDSIYTVVFKKTGKGTSLGILPKGIEEQKSTLPVKPQTVQPKPTAAVNVPKVRNNK